MSTIELRAKMKQTIDEMSAAKLQSAYDYMNYLLARRPSLSKRLSDAEREFRAGRGVPVGKLRRKYRRV